MKRRVFWRWAAVFAVVLVGLPAGSAYAVIPAVVGPVQALIAILPQLFGLLTAGAVALLKPATYKVLFKYLWTHKIFTVGLVAFCALAVWGIRHLGGGGVEKEQVGAGWSAFRGGPSRTGAVKGARGPQSGVKLGWRIKPRSSLEHVDSSPCVVGNRVYVSSGTLSVMSSDTSGAIRCYDTQKGGLVWEWTGQGLTGKFMGVFSSPAVGGRFPDLKGPDGQPEEGKYLVVGEGYHLNFDGRIICLNLEPVRKEGKAPELLWSKQTTCHVESSPAIFTYDPDGKGKNVEERAVIGAADDGVWCLSLKKGEVLWHIEGTPAYYVQAGPKAEEIAKLIGKTVAVTGTVERRGANVIEAGEVLIKDITEAHEAPNPQAEKLYVGEGFKRTVVGVVAVAAEDPKILEGNTSVPLKGASRVCIKPAALCIDAESSPIVAELPKDPAKPDGEKIRRVFIGSGINGHAVVCADADTGEIKWRDDSPNYPVFGAPTVVGDKVIVGMGNGDMVNSAKDAKGEVRCYDARGDGKPLWSVVLKDTVIGAVPVKDGLAYACCRDALVHIIDVDSGKEVGSFAVGSPMVCSPAVTAKAVYLTANNGKMFCFDRARKTLLWTYPLSPGMGVISSPAAAQGRIFVGTQDRGFFCLAEGPPRKAAPPPWAGPGYGPDRSGAADDRGLPSIAGAKAPRKWDWDVLRDRTAEGPLAAFDGQLYLPARAAGADAGADKTFLTRVDARLGKETWTPQDLGGNISSLAVSKEYVYALAGEKGQPQTLHRRSAATGAADYATTPPQFAEGSLALDGSRLAAIRGDKLVLLKASNHEMLWEKGLGTIRGAPLLAFGLVLVAVDGDKPRLVCLDQADSREIWSAALPGRPVGPPTLASERVFVACASTEEGKGFLVCRRALDGGEKAPPANERDRTAGWTAELPETPIGYPVASDEVVAVATAPGRVLALGAANGKLLREGGLFVGEGAQPPALVQGVLVFAGRNRLGAWNPITASWPWAFNDQGLLGKPLAPLVVAGETVFVASEKRGLVAVAPPPPPDIIGTNPKDGGEASGPRPRLEVSYKDDLYDVDPATLEIELSWESDLPGKKPPAPPPSQKAPVQPPKQEAQVPVKHGAYTFDCPELKIRKDDLVDKPERDEKGEIKFRPGRVITVVFTGTKPLVPGVYKATVSVANRRGARATESWKFTVKEGAQ